MKNSFEYSLLETGETIKRGYSLLLQNIGKTIATITGIIAVLVTFTEIGFCDIGAESMTSTALMMLVASYLIFFSLEDAGEKLGRETAEYKNAEENYITQKSKVGGEDIPLLRQFCADYSEEEMRFRKEAVLARAGYSFDEYKKYKNGERCSKEMLRAFRKADRIKPINLTPSELLAKGRKKERREFSNPEKWKTVRLILGLIPSSLCMLFTVSVMLNTKDGLTFADIAQGMLKLSTLPIIGLRGYSAGYSYAKGEAVFWLETRTRMLEAFLEKKTSTK